MNSELEKAIKERVDLGYSQERIANELRAAGYDEQTITHVYTAVTTGTPVTVVPAAGGGQLVGYWELISSSFSLLVEQWKLFLVSGLYGLVALAVLIGGIAGGAVLLESQPTVGLVLMIVGGLIGFVLVIALGLGVQRALLLRGQELPYLDHVKWCLRNIGGLIAVALFVQFVTSLGQLLLILPGIAFGVYLSYAMFIRLEDRGRMTMSLVQSAQLVYNRWWGVFGRTLVAFAFLTLCLVPFVVLLFVFGGTGLMMQFALGEPSLEQIGVALMIGGLLFIGAVLFVSIMMQCVMVRLYESLQSTASTYSEEGTKKLRTWMIVGIVLGIPASIVVQSIGAVGETQDDPFNSFIAPTGQEFVVPAEQQAEFDAFLEEFGDELDSF